MLLSPIVQRAGASRTRGWICAEISSVTVVRPTRCSGYVVAPREDQALEGGCSCTFNAEIDESSSIAAREDTGACRGDEKSKANEGGETHCV